MEELGDASSGFAIRRPPRAWERFKSPFMVDRLLYHSLIVLTKLCLVYESRCSMMAEYK